MAYESFSFLFLRKLFYQDAEFKSLEGSTELLKNSEIHL